MKPIILIIAMICAAQAHAEPFIAHDKQLHIAAGAVASSTGYMMAQAFHIKHPQRWGFAVGALAGLAKELHDRKQPGNHFDTKDMLATMLGGSIVFTYRF